MWRRICVLALAGAACLTAEPAIAGFAVNGSNLYTWGDGVYQRSLPHGRPKRLAQGSFSEGGCSMDVDGDGVPDLVLNQSGSLVWFHAPEWTRHVISAEVDALDMIPATVLDRRGLLLIHKRQQVRFYEVPSFRETEIYSIYTPSQEGGLLLADVDGDGRTDILCGNYWMQSPAEFGLPWREFAIDLWNEEPNSALLRLAYNGRRLAAQRGMANARLAWFDKPADPRQLWIPHPLGSVDLKHPSGLVIRGDLVFIGERGGEGRIIRIQGETTTVLRKTGGIVGLHLLDNARLLVIGRSFVTTMTDYGLGGGV